MKIARFYTKTRYLILVIAMIGIPYGLYIANKKDKDIAEGAKYAEEGNYLKAIEKYNDAIDISPNHKRAYLFRGTAYAGMGKLDEAIADYDKELSIDPKNQEHAQAWSRRPWST